MMVSTNRIISKCLRYTKKKKNMWQPSKMPPPKPKNMEIKISYKTGHSRKPSKGVWFVTMSCGVVVQFHDVQSFTYPGINEQNPALGTNTWKTDMNNRVSSMNRMNCLWSFTFILWISWHFRFTKILGTSGKAQAKPWQGAHWTHNARTCRNALKSTVPNKDAAIIHKYVDTL